MSEVKVERRGRPRTRPVDQWNEIERNYMKEYIKQRRHDPNDTLKLVHSRTYYRRVLKKLTPEDAKFEKVSQKLNDLDAKIQEKQSLRVRYQKQNILNKPEI